MTDDNEELTQRLWREFLETATITEWFVTASTMEYDGNSEIILWMAAHPHLDRATALTLYWYSQPSYYQTFASESDVPDANLDGWRVIQALQDRILSGNFGRSGIAYNPANDPTAQGDPTPPGYDWTEDVLTEADNPAWLIPQQLFEPEPGEEVYAYGYAEDEGWDYGLPPSVLDAIEELEEAQ